jgi:hypothetical protein
MGDDKVDTLADGKGFSAVAGRGLKQMNNKVI